MSADAIEILGAVEAAGPMVVTCEHAGRLVPPPLVVSEADAAWLATHWGWDIGAADVARALIQHTGSVGVLARYSRLVCDPNRDPSDPTWIRERLEEGGRAHDLSFNQDLGEAERQRRLTRYHQPYHDTIDALLARRLLLGADVLLFSVHSFTPLFGDEQRLMEIGVLFDHYEAEAVRLADGLAEQGFTVAMNEPYSGRKGLMYAVHRHGTHHGVAHLEIEIRHDLLHSPQACEDVGTRIARALEVLGIGRAQS